MDDLLRIAERLDAPWLLVAAIVLAFLWAAARVAAETWESVAKLFGPLGRRWTESRNRRLERADNLATLKTRVDEQERKIDEQQGELADAHREIQFLRDQRDNDAWRRDLERQVRNLSRELTKLRRRSAMTDSYLAYDVDYHRTLSLGGDQEDHVSYMEFERRWVRTHGEL